MKTISTKYYAFISYNHRDAKIAKWLQRNLESYKLPTAIHNELEDKCYLRPVFRDKSDLNTGILTNEIRRNLDRSKYLIVICSPNSAESDWVSQEVQTFIEGGRLEYIIPFVITLCMDNPNQLFPKYLRSYFNQNPQKELLGVCIAEDGREKAFVRIVSKMIGIDFDELWRRHERGRRKRIIITLISLPFFCALIYYFAVPVTFTLQIHDDRHSLPSPNDAVLIINGAEYHLTKLDTVLTVDDLPGYFKLGKVHVNFNSSYYQSLREDEPLGLGISNNRFLNLKRDNTFAVYAGKVIDDKGKPITEACVVIGNRSVMTDRKGYFHVSFPTGEQRAEKSVTISKKGFLPYHRIDECPGTNLGYILRRK